MTGRRPGAAAPWRLGVFGAGALAICACAPPQQNAANPAGGPVTEAIAELPLKRGFYVREGVACENASNATLILHQSDGFAYPHSFCTINSIESLGAERYRTIEHCEPYTDAGEPASTRTITYILSGYAAFQVDGSDAPGARFCAQRTLPEPWRSNDVPGLDK